MQTVLVVVAAIGLWGQAVAQLPTELTWPITWALSWPHGALFRLHGCVAVVPYTMMCLRASRAVLAACMGPEG